MNEIVALSGFGSFESLCVVYGAVTEGARDSLRSVLQEAGINPETPRFLPEGATERVVATVIAHFKARVKAWMAVRVPCKPEGRRGRLRDAFQLGKNAAREKATFEGWRKLPGPDGLMEARWSDGTVAYHRADGAVWLY